jgi:hypothetical protein
MFRIGLNFLADLMHRGSTDPNFSGNFGRGLTFSHPPQQQYRLGRTKVPPFKDGPAVKIVNPLAQGTAVDGQVAGLSLPKLSSLAQVCPTVGTFQPFWVKVFQEPLATEFIID